MAVKTHALFYKRDEGKGTNICVQIVHFFCWVQCLGVTFAALYFYIKPNCMTTMKRMLNRMLRYADAIVKRGVDKLIDAIAHSAETQTKNAETPQPQKSMGNDADCAPQTTDNTTDCGITLMDELCDISYNVLDRTPEVQWRDQADKGFVPVSELVRNTMVTAPFNGADSDEVRILWCSMRFAANAENIRTKGQKNKRYNACVSRLARKT